MDREIEKTGRRILRAPAVEDRTQRSRVQCWRDIKAGKFPAPVQLGPNSVGWFEDEIDAWLAARPRRTYRAPASKELQPVKKSRRAKKKPKPSSRPGSIAKREARRRLASPILRTAVTARV